VSAENVEFVTGLLSAGSELPKEQLLPALPQMIEEACDPEIEFVETPERVDAKTYHGHAGALEAFTQWLDQWEEYSTELESAEDHGDQVFCVMREHGRGAGSGASADAVLYLVFSFRDGKIHRYQEFYDEAAARAALEST
jgi:ketosteroid isomerase-like protein